jgi:hypothetical protein
MNRVAALSFTLVLVACNGGSSSPDEPVSVSSLAAQLAQASIDPKPFTDALSAGKTADEIAGLLPEPYRSRALSLREPQPSSSQVEGDELGSKGLKLGPAGNRIAVVLIANGAAERWLRNLAEWFALGYFDVHMRKHYALSHVCMGDNGTWSCFRDGLTSQAAGYDSIDVLIQTHGYFEGTDSTAQDNQGTKMTAAAALESEHGAHYRYGMFMNCFAAHSEAGGFAQVFLRNGGISAYGAPDLSSPFSDLIFESRFGTFGQIFAAALEQANSYPLETISVEWSDLQYQGWGMSHKQLFGRGDVRVSDDFPRVCIPSKTEPCYPGPATTLGVGICIPGLRTCAPDGSAWGACVGAVLPRAEVCGDVVDDDCDGVLAPCPGECKPGETASCYTGPAGTQGVGVCKAGSRLCDGAGHWGTCVGQALPSAEICGNTVDESCDGAAAPCTPAPQCAAGETKPCYPGPAGTQGVGICHAGVQTCDATLHWGACVGAVLPVAEIAGDGVDQDCNGKDALPPGDCAPGATRPCYAGPAGTQNVGLCKAGVQVCDGTGHWAAGCGGAVLPAAEICGDGIDQDCNGSDCTIPFAITSVDRSATVKMNGGATDIHVYWKGAPVTFPVTATLHNTSCPLLWSCLEPSVKWDSPSTPLVWSGAQYCKGFALFPKHLGYQIQLVDAAGRTTPAADASFDCVP